MPYSLSDLLRLGFPIQPEQVWLHEQTEAHVMIAWPLEDTSHAHCCGEVQALRDTGQGGRFPPMVVPTPAVLQLDPSFGVEQHAFNEGEEILEVPALILEPASPLACCYDHHAVYLWDAWPITSQEFDDLQAGHENLYEGLGFDLMERATISCAHEQDYEQTGEISDEVLDLLDAQGLSEDFLTEYQLIDEQGFSQAVMAAEQQVRDRLEDALSEMYERHTMRRVHNLMGLDTLDIGRHWYRLERVSKQCWRRLPLTVPRQARSAYEMQFRHLNPWWDGWR